MVLPTTMHAKHTEDAQLTSYWRYSVPELSPFQSSPLFQKLTPQRSLPPLEVHPVPRSALFGNSNRLRKHVTMRMVQCTHAYASGSAQLFVLIDLA